MKKLYAILFVLSAFALAANNSLARPERVGQIPNGTRFSCANCHVNPSGGGERNPFGMDVEEGLSSGQVQWNGQLAGKDSDGDGQTNGFELQDPTGAWRPGNPQPGNATLVTNPGDPNSKGVADAPNFAFSLSPAFPNPGPGVVNFTVESAAAGLAEVAIYNYSGAKVAEISGVYLSVGKTIVNWNGKDFTGAPVPSGSYIVSVAFKGKSGTAYVTLFR